ncbi:PIG-L deacetylase family protein [Actinokineospora sp. HUAS TT18]|uniref:PIG-L deacetylase family protein n=1 Tax=Actinokineospora sp. HUAS TT18 TaxID=3447451 RepID=UPI003F5215BF
MPAPLSTPSVEVSELGTVLGIWAHPDDEVFLSGGLMAAARDAGQRVVCVTATRGELGTPDPITWPPPLLAEVRALEQQTSLAILGVTEHHQLGIPDGACANWPHDAVVDRLIKIMTDVRPDTIITFGPDGFTGHSDHQKVSEWATEARARGAARTRLLYATTSAEFLDEWQHVYDRVDVFLVEGLPARIPSNKLSVQVRLEGESADRKLKALQAQVSQTEGLLALLGAETVRDWCSIESFIDAEASSGFRAEQAWSPGQAV